jgi:hypothetical protein
MSSALTVAQAGIMSHPSASKRMNATAFAIAWRPQLHTSPCLPTLTPVWYLRGGTGRPEARSHLQRASWAWMLYWRAWRSESKYQLCCVWGRYISSAQWLWSQCTRCSVNLAASKRVL